MSLHGNFAWKSKTCSRVELEMGDERQEQLKNDFFHLSLTKAWRILTIWLIFFVRPLFVICLSILYYKISSSPFDFIIASLVFIFQNKLLPVNVCRGTKVDLMCTTT